MGNILTKEEIINNFENDIIAEWLSNQNKEIVNIIKRSYKNNFSSIFNKYIKINS
jgi:hypothetical protein